jgi:hypothetical protein
MECRVFMNNKTYSIICAIAMYWCVWRTTWIVLRKSRNVSQLTIARLRARNIIYIFIYVLTVIYQSWTPRTPCLSACNLKQIISNTSRPAIFYSYFTRKTTSGASTGVLANSLWMNVVLLSHILSCVLVACRRGLDLSVDLFDTTRSYY